MLSLRQAEDKVAWLLVQQTSAHIQSDVGPRDGVARPNPCARHHWSERLPDLGCEGGKSVLDKHYAKGLHHAAQLAISPHNAPNDHLYPSRLPPHPSLVPRRLQRRRRTVADRLGRSVGIGDSTVMGGGGGGVGGRGNLARMAGGRSAWLCVGEGRGLCGRERESVVGL